MPEKAKSRKTNKGDLDLLSINTIRMLSADAVERANSGHPGAPMGVAPMAYTLWTRYLRHNPADPGWPNRDRFVLSMGHASMLIYSMLHLTGYDLSLEDLKNFRQWGSPTPGHPEFGQTPGVETTTGPLGQGVGNAVGLALAERLLAASFNEDGYPIFDHFTYAFCSDGDLMEGVASEAASLAGHLKLGKLICLYDDNRITIDGSTDLTFSEDVGKRFRAYGWHVVGPIDGSAVDEVDGAIKKARRADRPSLIVCRTTIAEGSPNKADTADAHGAPLGAKELRLTKENLGWPQDEPFHVPHEVGLHMSALDAGASHQRAWVQLLEKYTEAHPEKAARLQREINDGLPDGWEQYLPEFEVGSKAMATRGASGKVVNALAPIVENLVGGSADLSPSNKTYMEEFEDQSADNPGGRNLRFGVREHGMGAIINGLLLHGGLRAYGGTFLVFSDYMRPSIRLAALMGIPAIYVFTHDSVGLGEDGPTHQPIEHTMSLRLIPGLNVIRPADPNETSQAWRMALERTDGPTALLLTRQNVPVLDPRRAEGTSRGGYVLSRTTGAPRVVLIATGSEVQTALEAKAMLEADAVATQVVSLPCWEVFQQQSAEYIESVIPTGALAVAIEAGVTLGWERWTGGLEFVQGIDRFGASAPSDVLFTKFGITADALARRVRKHLEE